MTIRAMRFFFLAVLLLCSAVHVGHAASDDYIYRQRVNYVKISEFSKKDLEEIAPNHPYAKLTASQMKAILLSLRLSRELIIKKDIDAQEIFLDDEAERFAPYLVEAFKQVEPNERVVLSVVQKRPTFILRNDRLTLALLWIEGNAMHIRFDKVYAKLTGDYEATGNNERLVRDAKSIRVALETGPGQTLSTRGASEIEIDLKYDFARKLPTSTATQSTSGASASTTPQSSAPAAPRTVQARLEELEALKKQGLISKDEYEQMRKAILSDL